MNSINHIKRAAKRIKKKHPHVTLTQVQKDLADYLGFSNWKHMLSAPEEERQRRIKNYPLGDL